MIVNLYANLESTEITYVPLEDLEAFEARQCILRIKQCNIEEYGMSFTTSYFWQCRDWFCKQLLIYPKKDVVKILKTSVLDGQFFKKNLNLSRTKNE